MNILKPDVPLNVSNIDASVAFYEKAFGVTARSESRATPSSTSKRRR